MGCQRTVEGIINPVMHCCLTFSASFISYPSSSTSTFLSLPLSLPILHLLRNIPYLTSPLLSSHLISSHLISSHLISSHLISSHLISSHLISSPLLSSPLLSSSHLLLFSPSGSMLASSAVRQGRYRHRHDRVREDLGLLDSSPIENIQSGYVMLCTLCILCTYAYVSFFKCSAV
jgi:hypothetical protein